MTNIREIEMQELTSLRSTSQQVSQLLRDCLVEYLETLGGLLTPGKVLGEHMEGHTGGRIKGADETRALVEQQFSRLCREDFSLAAVLPSPVPRINPRLKVYPWEYPHEIGGQTVTITSPVRWVIAYDLPYDLSHLLRSVAAGEKPQANQLKQLVINSLVMQIAMSRQRGLRRILGDLRFEVEEQTSSVAGAVPFVVAHAGLEAFRPQDELIETVTQLSGRRVFEEIIAPEALNRIPDPLADRIRQLAAGA
jgi:hypothetical protein